MPSVEVENNDCKDIPVFHSGLNNYMHILRDFFNGFYNVNHTGFTSLFFFFSSNSKQTWIWNSLKTPIELARRFLLQSMGHDRL